MSSISAEWEQYALPPAFECSDTGRSLCGCFSDRLTTVVRHIDWILLVVDSENVYATMQKFLRYSIFNSIPFIIFSVEIHYRWNSYDAMRVLAPYVFLRSHCPSHVDSVGFPSLWNSLVIPVLVLMFCNASGNSETTTCSFKSKICYYVCPHFFESMKTPYHH